MGAVFALAVGAFVLGGVPPNDRLRNDIGAFQLSQGQCHPQWAIRDDRLWICAPSVRARHLQIGTVIYRHSQAFRIVVTRNKKEGDESGGLSGMGHQGIIRVGAVVVATFFSDNLIFGRFLK